MIPVWIMVVHFIQEIQEQPKSMQPQTDRNSHLPPCQLQGTDCATEIFIPLVLP